ncbi:polysaccharide deacetylase family protein [Roseateles sp. LYH14W]|uniref:Polysaccharide deacetylase family protein n=1 Tax=Pelomonas parva TaxID=3299032 RepID=A0ABW7EVE3_9BURK
MKRMMLAALGLFASVAATAAPFVWPNGAQAAVTLGYDDALASQLDHVIPALNKRGLRGSFYIPINGPTLPARQDEWKAAAAAGHELGNHSLFHSCSAKAPGREWVLPHRDLDKQTPAQVQEHILAANTWLQSLDGKTRRTFTPPCLDLKAGGQDFVKALQPHFVAYRAANPAMVTDTAAMDPYAMPVYFVEGWTGEQLIALVEKAAAQRAVVSLLFHGVGAEHLSVTREAHDQLLDHLAKNKARLWTDTMVNVMENARKQAGR